MRLCRKICLPARIAGNAAKGMAAPISPSLRLTISVAIWAWIVNDLCAVTARCPAANRLLPRLKTAIVYSGISSAPFIRLNRICVGNGHLLKVLSWMHQTGRPWRLLVQGCGPILATIRYLSASASLSKKETINLDKVNPRLPKVLKSCDDGVME